MDAMIMTAFPQYKQEEIESWYFDKAAKMFAMAEWALREIRGVPIEIQFIDPTEQKNVTPSLPPPPDPSEMMGYLR